MTKTRSQNPSLTIKEETDNDKHKLTQLLNNNENTVTNNENKNNRTRNTKTRDSKRVLVPARTVKQETTYTKPASSPSTKKLSGPWITQEQIKELIGHMTKEKITIKQAAKKVEMSYGSAQFYYRTYKNDHKHRLPLPKIASKITKKTFTYEEVEQLIGYLVNDNMDIQRAAKKLNMKTDTARKYYSMYMKGPDHNIPEPDIPNLSTSMLSAQRITLEHIKEFLDCLLNDKMTVSAACRKVGINKITGFRYYYKDINDPERKIPIPSREAPDVTDDQIKTLIRCIVDNNMPITMASGEANMSYNRGRKYYRKYLNDPKHFLQNRPPSGRIGKDRIKTLICYIFNDKLKIKDAAERVGISKGIAYKYYYSYIRNPEKYDFIPQVIFTDTNLRHKFDERLKKMFEYIVDDKMSLPEASKKANVGRTTADKYYKAYLNDPEHKIPKQVRLGLSKDKIRRVIGYIVHDKMTLGAASKRANVSRRTTHIYYSMYTHYVDPKASLCIKCCHVDSETPEDLLQVFSEIHEKKMTAEKAQVKKKGPKPPRPCSAIKLEPLELDVKEKDVKRYNTRSRTNLTGLSPQ